MHRHIKTRILFLCYNLLHQCSDYIFIWSWLLGRSQWYEIWKMFTCFPHWKIYIQFYHTNSPVSDSFQTVLFIYSSTKVCWIEKNFIFIDLLSCLIWNYFNDINPPSTVHWEIQQKLFRKKMNHKLFRILNEVNLCLEKYSRPYYLSTKVI